MMKEKWYKGVYRRQLTDMHINDDKEVYLSKFNADDYYENLRLAKVESPMIYLQSHTGLCNFPTKVARTHKAMMGEYNEIMRLVDLLRSNGMKVVGYYSLIFNNYAVTIHPQWEMRDCTEKTWRDRGQRYGLCCPNNKEYRAFLVENIKEMMAYFKDLDGYFYDMPYWEVVCCCDSCKKRYFEETGRQIPTKANWEDGEWLEFVKKRQEWMGEFADFVKGISTSLSPNSTCEFNFAAVIGTDWLGGSTEVINEHSEFTGGDLYGNLYNHSFTAKYYYSITKNQPFEYMSCRFNKNLRENTVTKPQQMLETEILLTLAHHGATLNIDTVNPDGTMDRGSYERLGRVYESQIPYEKYMDKGKLYAEVGVYFDSKTQFYTPYSKTYNKLCAINVHKTLVENHIPVSVVSNGTRDLDVYKMIIAPCLQNFDNDEVLKLVDFVEKGGVLYLSGKSDDRLIDRFFGAKFSGYTYGDSAFCHIEKGYNEVQAYISATPEYKEIFGEFCMCRVPICYKLPVFKGVKGKVLATITLPYTDPDDNYNYASIHSNPPGYDTDIPAVIEVNYKKGKVIWSIAHIENDERQNFKDLFISLVNKEITQKYKVTTKKHIESIIFEDGNDIYISFVDINCYYEYSDEKYSVELPYIATRVENLTTGEVTTDISLLNGTLNKFCMIKITK